MLVSHNIIPSTRRQTLLRWKESGSNYNVPDHSGLHRETLTRMNIATEITKLLIINISFTKEIQK